MQPAQRGAGIALIVAAGGFYLYTAMGSLAPIVWCGAWGVGLLLASWNQKKEVA